MTDAPVITASQVESDVVVDWSGTGSQPANTYDVVAQGGLDNTGGSDCTSAVGTCITYYKNHSYDGLYFPAGTYLLSTTLTVPNGTNLYGPTGSASSPGCAVPTAHLRGAVVYNSTSSFTDLRIGDSGKIGIINGAAASNTTFTRCQFRGGGAAYTYPMRFGGGTNSADHITFTDCNVERNLTDAGNAESYQANNLAWLENSTSLTGSHMEYIYFTRCDFGVSNGSNTGCPRMNVELWEYDNEGNAIRHGYHHVWFTDCRLRASDMSTLNIPGAIYNAAHTDAYVYVDGCTIESGGSVNQWPGTLSIEGVNYVTINDCDIYPGRMNTVSFINSDPRSTGANCNHAVFTNNRIHGDDYSFISASVLDNFPWMVFEGTSHLIQGNTLTVNPSNSQKPIHLWLGYYYSLGARGYAHNCDVFNNTFYEMRTGAPGNPQIVCYDTSDCRIGDYDGAHTSLRNTFRTARTSGPEQGYWGTNTGTTVIDGTNNTIIHA